MILCSVSLGSLTNMAAHLSALLLLTGLSGIQSLPTVRKVSVKAGGSISVPCLYESKYTNHVKYLCEGSKWNSCSSVVKSKTTIRSGKFSISDNKQERIFTVTIAAKTVGTHYYWCAVEIDHGYDIGTSFQLSVTKDQAPLSVDHQEVTGFTGESLSIHIKESYAGRIQWCRLGGSCMVEASNKEWEGIRVTITQMWNPKTITVTLSGLKTQSSGWYTLTRGDQRMPVYVTVKERPSTTTPKTTSPSILQTVNLTSVPTVNTTVNNTAQTESPRTFINPLRLILPLTLLAVIVILTLIICITWRRHKQTKTQSSAAAVAEEEVTYSTVSHSRQTNKKAEEGVTYSTVSNSRQTNKKAEEGVTYSTVSHSRQTNKKAEEGVTYSTVSHSRQNNTKAEEGVTYSTVSHSKRTNKKQGPEQEEDVTYSTVALH